MADEPSKEPTPDGWKAGDLVWEVAPDEVTPAIQAELEAHLAQQRAEAEQDAARETLKQKVRDRVNREKTGK